MSEIKKKPVGITETILRDAHQSQIATRMTTEQMLPIIDKMDQVGYHSGRMLGRSHFCGLPAFSEGGSMGETSVN